jgi:GT2 family glycosyltransferase
MTPDVFISGPDSAPLDSLSRTLGELARRSATKDLVIIDPISIQQRTGAPTDPTRPLADTRTSPVADLIDPSRYDTGVLVCHHDLGANLAKWRRDERPAVAILLVPSLEHVLGRAQRGGHSVVGALARYERDLRQCANEMTNLPTFVVDLAQVDGVGEELVEFLRRHGVPTEDVLCDALQSALFVPEVPSLGLAPAPRELEDLQQEITKLAGPQERLELELGVESPWTTEVLQLAEDVEQLVDALLWNTAQIEPIVRASATRAQASAPVPVRERSDDEANEDPEGDGPYPLNAGEDRRAYHRWLTAHRLPTVISPLSERGRAATRAPLRRRQPLISVLVPVWKTPLWALRRCVGSVLEQDFGDWELCLCDDASGDAELTEYLKGLKRRDRRISVVSLEQNSGISLATNAALEIAQGRYVAFLDHDDELTPDALSSVADAIAANPDADVFYSDEDKIDAKGERFDPAFKPDWSPDLLMSFAYVCHLTVIRTELVRELGGLRREYDGSQDYDLSLRATERAREVVHIPKVLYHWRTLPGSAASDSAGTMAKPWAYEAGRRALEDALVRRGESGEVNADQVFPGRYHVRRALKSNPLVSIIIPFRDEPALLATCARSLRADPGYDNYELVLVDNGSELPETETLLEQLSASDNVRIVRSPGPFNWPAINNEAAAACRGDVLLFANNDIEARVGRWLDALLGHALRPEVGAVGARLVYPDNAIQHAGVVIGLGGIAGHVLRGLPGDHPGYGSMAIATRNCSVVTGACMMTRREVFESVGGFDESLPVAFNDVDFCLKLRDRGYLIVYTPMAELVHHESRSRGHTDDLMESKLILRRWGRQIAQGDPYMNVNLSHWRYWCPLSTDQEDVRWKTYLKTSVLTPDSSSST